MEKISMKPGTMLAPVPVVMVSCGAKEEEYNIITIAWTGIINSEPPMTYVSIRPSRLSHEIIERNKAFVINICNESLVATTDFCGVRSGRDVNKFKERELTLIQGEEINCPIIEEAPVNLECKVVDTIKYNTHDMFVAEIVKVHVDSNLMDGNGKINMAKADLICYSHGEYFGLQKKAFGKFGFSVMKQKTKNKKDKEQKGRYRKGKHSKFNK